jgi:hypothetical protein
VSAGWAKNEVTAVKRRCGLIILKNDGAMSPRETNFSGLAIICGVNSPHFDTALGTITNQRKPLNVPGYPALTGGLITSVDDDDDTVEIAGHGFEIGDGPVQLTTGFPIPAGTATLTDYWVVPVDVDNFKFALSVADAYAGIVVDITDLTDGGMVEVITGAQRGVDGHFVYEATQAETNHDAAETIVCIDTALYERDLGGGAYTTVLMSTSFVDFGEAELENGLTRDDAWRVILRSLAAVFSKSGNDYVFRDMADSKDSHHGTVTSAGRVDAEVDDPT